MRVLLFIFMIFCNCRTVDHTSRTPNILLIMVDDMGFGDVSHSGNPHIQTPNLDQWASESINFSHFYVSPVCAPTRASLLTGKYHQRTGVHSVTNGYETINPQEVTLAEILKEKGYRTGIFGKWHLGEYYPSTPNAQGFDEFLGFRTGHTSDYYDAVLEKNGLGQKTKGYISDVLTDHALDFMSTNYGTPFFCFLSFNAPHTPLFIDSTYFSKFLSMGLDERTSRVYGMIENIDENIGKIVFELRKQELEESTIIVFISDNGPINGWKVAQDQMRYNAGLRDQKFTIYEGGIRTQNYWQWKNNWQGGRTIDHVAAHIDLVPTVTDILGMESDPKIDGISLLPLLENKTEKIDRTFLQKYDLSTLGTDLPFPGGVVRKDNWKMINGEHLYDLEKDPGENIDLAKQHPEVFADLKNQYNNWWQSISSEYRLTPLPIPVGHPEENPVYIKPHHGIARGTLEYTGHRGLTGERIGTHPRGVDGDWLAKWTPGGKITWEINTAAAGQYEAILIGRDSGKGDSDFLIQVDDYSSKMHVDFGTKEWTLLVIDTFNLDKKNYKLTLQMVRKSENTKVEIREIGLRRLNH